MWKANATSGKINHKESSGKMIHLGRQLVISTNCVHAIKSVDSKLFAVSNIYFIQQMASANLSRIK